MKSSQVNPGDSGLASQYNNLRADAYGGSMFLPHAQSTPNMTLYVEPGVCYILGTRVIFAGGNSPSFSAPSSGQKRIDILYIKSDGSLNITQGTATSGTPTAPSYPTDGSLVLCEVYLRGGMSSIKDADDSTNGYVYNDVRPFLLQGISSEGQIASGVIKSLTGGEHVFGTATGSSNAFALSVSPAPTAYTAGDVYSFIANFSVTGAVTLNVNSLGAVTIKKNYNQDLISNDIVNGQLITVIYDGTYFQIPSPGATKGYVDSQLTNLTPAFTEQQSDTVGWNNSGSQGTTSTSFVKVKETLLNCSLAAVRVKYDYFCPGGQSAWFQLYKNGVALGTQVLSNGGSATQTDNIGSVSSGDLLQVYARITGGATPCTVQNFKLCFDTKKTAEGPRTLNTTILFLPYFSTNPTNNQ